MIRRWLATAFRTDVRNRSLKVALLVGTILGIINYYDRILGWDFSSTEYLKIGLTYLVPFCVSTHASVSAILRGPAGALADPGMRLEVGSGDRKGSTR